MKRKKKEQDSKREREREVSRQREQSERERERTLREVKRGEYQTEYLTLLKEKVRDPEASWTKTRKVLENEPRFSGIPLTPQEKEDLFREHTRKLMDARRNDFESLIRERVESGAISLGSVEFEEKVKKQLREDPRYEKLNKDEREYSFKTVMRQLKADAFKKLETLLLESKNTGIITRHTQKTGEKFEHLKTLLKNDKRYFELDDFPEEREKFVGSFLDRTVAKEK